MSTSVGRPGGRLVFPPMVLLPMVQAVADASVRRITLAVHAVNEGMPMEVTVK